MAKSSFFGGTGISAANSTALESSTAAAAASETAAAASATSAATSAASASSNVSTNAASAAASEVSRQAALVAKTAAETAEANAETAETNSANTATAGANSATASASSATAAASSATASEASKVTSVNSASTATTKASEASTSASGASTSASTATTKASESETARAASVVAKDASVAAKDASVVAKDASVVSQNAAAASATSAASSASGASTSASTATTKASEASTSATASETSKAASVAAKDAALAALDSFDDRYLGSKSSAPTVDNDGDALAAGMLYFDTTSDSMKVYEGSAWVNAYASLSGAALQANNLSDLADVGAARTNLGLGTAATTAATAYATAAQGTKVDGIEASATADQTDTEIRTAVESASDSNVFTDADHTKLNAIEASADVTDATNVTASGALMDSELTAIASVKALNQGVATTDSPTFSNLTLSGTDSVKVPSGTTAQRPASGVAGMFRYSSTLAAFEGYTTEWGEIGGGGSTDISLNTFTGDGSDLTFSLSAAAAENNTFVYIDGVYQNKATYAVSSASPAVVTFSTAPPNGTAIEIMSAAISVTSVGVPSDNTITTAKIADAAVTTVKIADNAVTAAKLTSGDYDFDSITVRGAITEDAVTLTGTSTTIDLATATNFVHDLTGATTYTFSNPASTGNATAFTLKIIQDSTARAITWPSSVDWAGGTAPTLTATDNGVDVFVFYTIDGGTTYYGFTAGQEMA